MEGQHRQDRQRWRLHNLLWKATEKKMDEDREKQGLPRPPVKIGNVTQISFKKKNS